MIGSGWISPREQYPAYLSYLEQNELVDTSSESYNALQRTVAACERKLTHLASKGGKGMVLVSDCEQILGAMSRATSKESVSLARKLEAACSADAENIPYAVASA